MESVMKKPSNVEHEWTWNKAVENCKKNGIKGKKAYEEEYERLMMIREKPRRVFDKHLLCFKKNIGTKDSPEWDYIKTTQEMIKKNRPERDSLFRTVKLITSGKCETFADVLKFRVDWLTEREEGENYGSPEALRASIDSCKMNLTFIDDELELLGFERMNFAESLEEEDRTDSDDKALQEKLEKLGLKRKDEEEEIKG